MTENANPNQEPGAEQSQETAENFSDEILRELTVIGNKFVKVVDAAWRSEERKTIEAELKEGLANIAANLETGYQRVSENEKAQEVLNKAEDVASSLGEQMRNSEAVKELADGLVGGLRTLGAQLEKMAGDLHKGKEPGPAASQEAQDIPIDDA